ncbi:MAG: glutathione S-transferase [Comamonas sp.]
MLTLCGFAVSNYYNKVKLALLEKGMPFAEELVWLEQVDRSASPLGKVPYLRTTGGTVCESGPILDYLEAQQPTPALLPADPLQAAKVRELNTFLELHLELVARQLYPEAFFGGQVSDATKARTRKQLDQAIPAFAALARWQPFIAGEQFTQADCAAIVHLPLIGAATKAIYGQDLLAHLPVQDYLGRMRERASVQRVQADRKANQPLMAAHYAALAQARNATTA